MDRFQILGKKWQYIIYEKIKTQVYGYESRHISDTAGSVLDLHKKMSISIKQVSWLSVL